MFTEVPLLPHTSRIGIHLQMQSSSPGPSCSPGNPCLYSSDSQIHLSPLRSFSWRIVLHPYQNSTQPTSAHPKLNLASLFQKLVPKKHNSTCPCPRLPIFPYSQPPVGFFLYYFSKSIISTHTATRKPHSLISHQPIEEASNWTDGLPQYSTPSSPSHHPRQNSQATHNINNRHPLQGSLLLTG